jgi:hypothetical protein
LAACDDFNRSLEDDIDFYRSVTPVSSWAELKSAAEGTAGPGLIGLAGDIELDSAATTINITRPLTVTAFEGRRVVRRGAAFTADPLFRVDAGGGLTLGHSQGGTLVLDGGAGGIQANAPLVSVGTGGALTLQDGAVLQNNDNNAASGGGVYVANGSFEMKGGTISGNSGSGDRGGGVYVIGVGGSGFQMKGGTISGNSSEYGSGVYFNSGSVFTMTGGTISGNAASREGGGVYAANGSFEMNGGTISNNSSNSGGGVYFNSGSVFTMTGGTIGGNSAPFHGGGVYASGSFEMSGGTIGGNSAGYYGGGVYVSGSFEMSGGTIGGNSAGYYGGGVFLSGIGVFTMNGGTIGSNIANNSGGGVYVGDSGSFKKEPETAGGASGVIYGSGEGGNSNLVKDGSGSPVDDKGHAVYVNNGPKKRDNTAGPGVTLDSTVSGPSGGWE